MKSRCVQSPLSLRLRAPLFAFFANLRDETGSALVELALTLSFVGIPLLLGTGYTGVVLIDYMEVVNAAHAGAEYAMVSSAFAEDTSNIQVAAQEESSRLGSNLVVTPSIFYACSSAIGGTQYSTGTAATTACTGTNNHALEFVKVLTSATVTPPLSFPGFPKTVTLNGSSVMEVEE